MTDIVGHREGDFDFHPFLSQILPYVTSVHYCHFFSGPVSVVSPSISLKRISLSGLILTHTMRLVFKWFAET
jgi:hypothetical protein